MFEASQLLFFYAQSPVHMGAGSAIGAIDSPIQREVHTQHPMFAGSGLKGALRHHLGRAWTSDGQPGGPRSGLVQRIFGPDTNASDHAGALSLSDAQLVALPVRSLKGAYAYVTSPLALARLHRLALQAGLQPGWPVPDAVAEGSSRVASANLLYGRQLILESFEFAADVDQALAEIARWIASAALTADSNAFFRAKFQSDLVLLSDTDFSHFARHAMVVEPHVRINDVSGTADDGGLFYVENLPPESLLAGLVQASLERRRGDGRHGDKPPLMTAREVLATVLAGPDPATPGIAGRVLQIGGDAGTGRGLVLVQPVAPAK